LNIIEIYGSKIEIPTPTENDFVENWDTDIPSNQYWRKRLLPKIFDLVEYDKDSNAILDQEQRKFAMEEVRRCKEGFFFMNNGEVTWITGKNYFYLSYWKLEDDIYPDYRNLDRKYFLFLNHWENVPSCLGIVIGKKRRQGATSVATSNLVYECIFYKNSFCGLTSKTQIDAKTAFTNMIAFGYRQLPVFLKPKQLNNKDSVSELVFAHKTVEVKAGKASAIDSDTGHRSKVDYRAPSLNAYDSGRLSRGLFDEGSKFPREVPFSTFISIVSKTLVKGAQKVGFIECPSTTNSMVNGGAEFKKVWDNANQFKYERTPNRLVKYMTPAYDGYMGFIGRYGESVINEPTPEQFKYLVENFVGAGDLTEDDIRLGAKKYLELRRSDLKGADLEEEIRMNPFNEDEMFMSANTDCPFNSLKLGAQKKYLDDNPPYLRTVTFYRKSEDEIAWRDDKDGFWKILAFPKEGEENKYKYEVKLKKPDRIKDGVISVDSYSNNQGGQFGSKAGAYIIRKFDSLDPENTGLPVAQFYGRPTEKSGLHGQIMLAAEYYGFLCSFEMVSDDYFSFFKERGKIGYLMRFPENSIDPIKRGKDTYERHYGYPTTPFALTKALDEGISYVEHFCHKIYFIELIEQMLLFDANNRTKSDLVVAFINGLVCASQTVYLPKPPKDPLIKVYGERKNSNITNPAHADY